MKKKRTVAILKMSLLAIFVGVEIYNVIPLEKNHKMEGILILLILPVLVSEVDDGIFRMVSSFNLCVIFCSCVRLRRLWRRVILFTFILIEK